MLIIEMAKIESTGGHIEIMLVIEITKIKLTPPPKKKKKKKKKKSCYFCYIKRTCNYKI